MDFLSQVSIGRLRREICNICDSYSNPWDILAELIQNSVDAIHLHCHRFGSQKPHEIDIELDVRKRQITIIDTGVGICPKELPELLAPHGTNKNSAETTLIGEKGVGLTYTIFSSNNYSIETKSCKGFIRAKIENAQSWKKGNFDTLPDLVIEESNEDSNDSKDTYTKIVVSDIEKNHEEYDDIFNITYEQLILHLRTKTAIGSVKYLFNSNFHNEYIVNFSYIDQAGVKSSGEIEPHYYSPEDFIQSKNAVIEIETFKGQAATMSDSEKARKLNGKCLRKVCSEKRYGRTINYYALFVPSQTFWESICDQNRLKVEIDGNSILQYTGGIYFATRGMPTGIRIEPPKTASPFYWQNIYMVIEDDSIIFDIGRKAIPSRSLGLFRDIAKEIFSEFLKFVEYVRTDPPVHVAIPTTAFYLKSEYFQELKKLPDLKLPQVSFLKFPDGQEASVVALFHELIGSKTIVGYHTLKMGYKMTYDEWSIYRIPEGIENLPTGLSPGNELPIVIEFKYRAEDILNDFNNDTKYFTDIDLLVCWDLDVRKFAKEGVAVEPISGKSSFFYGANYKLIWPGSYNLGTAAEKSVISLRLLIDDIMRKQQRP